LPYYYDLLQANAKQNSPIGRVTVIPKWHTFPEILSDVKTLPILRKKMHI